MALSFRRTVSISQIQVPTAPNHDNVEDDTDMIDADSSSISSSSSSSSSSVSPSSFISVYYNNSNNNSNINSNVSQFMYCAPIGFLNVCFRCGLRLTQQADIFMYRGDTAFCSEECRQHQILIDEHLSVTQECKASKDQPLQGTARVAA